MTGFLNRVKVTTATTGQGTSIVLGAAVNDSFFAPADVGAVNAQTYSYIIIQGLDFEIQVGQTYTAAGTTIARGTPVKSKIGGSVGTTKINLDGSALVGFIASAEDVIALIVAAASDTVAGKVELATQAEAEAQTDTARAVTPQGLANYALTSEVPGLVPAASDTAQGKVELATQAEAEAQTDTARAVTPSGLANFALLSEVTKTQVGLGSVTNDAQLKIASNLGDVNNAVTSFTNIKQAASTTATGVSELATQTEAEARTDTVRAVTPGSLANFVLSTEVAGNVPTATDTAQGKVELATQAEAEAQADTGRAVTPYGLANFALLSEVTKTQVGLGNVSNDAQLKIASNLSDVNNAATSFGNIKQTASDTATGVVELATAAEAEAQTDTARAVTPAGLANFALLSEVTKNQVGLGSVDNVQQMPLTYLDTDDALTANSDTKVASQNATKAYADLKLAKASNLSDLQSAATAYGNIKQAATESATGAVELATVAEAEAQTDTARAVTPAGLANFALLSETLQPGVADQTISGGARITVLDLGNLSGTTKTPDPGDRPFQKITNNGAGTIAPGTNYGSYLLDVINTTGAGAITTSGWTKKAGDAFDTTTTSKFRCHCSVTADGSLMSVLKVA